MGSLVEVIYCGRGNRQLDSIAVELGILYGVRLPHSVFYPLYFADQNWHNPVRQKYMDKLAQHRPTWATVLDLEREDQFEEVMSWADEASQYIKGLIIIPKVSGIIRYIPDCVNGVPVRLGYSTPTKYGKTTVSLDEFGERPIHLLGGSPLQQWYLAHQMNVVSLDCNYISFKALNYGEYCDHKLHWCKPYPNWKGQKNGYMPAFLLSCFNLIMAYRKPILKRWNQSTLF